MADEKMSNPIFVKWALNTFKAAKGIPMQEEALSSFLLRDVGTVKGMKQDWNLNQSKSMIDDVEKRVAFGGETGGT